MEDFEVMDRPQILRFAQDEEFRRLKSSLYEACVFQGFSYQSQLL